MKEVLENLSGWAQEVFLVDSYSQDLTIDIALNHGIHVIQREFRGFGDQWNFALRELPISAPWTMKLDPDERLTVELKDSIQQALASDAADAFTMDRRLWFMGRPLPVRQELVRIWRTGNCRFSDVAVNEHPIVEGAVTKLPGELEHHDSPDLDHWLEKQNRYTTAEAIMAYQGAALADQPRLLGSSMQRRMWLKKHFRYVPFRFPLLFVYHWLVLGSWRTGWIGYVWARLRCDVYRFIEYKRKEIDLTGRLPIKHYYGPGKPDARVGQID